MPLGRYALCDTAIGKDDVYLLCDAVWEAPYALALPLACILLRSAEIDQDLLYCSSSEQHITRAL